jgi:serine/threonine-protein kinase
MPPRLAPFSLPDRYRLEGGIAAGGMAAVYAAHDVVLDRPVAVKVLAEHLNSDDSARRRFQREARAAAALSSHPAVVTIFDVGEHEGRSFIVMERRTGGTVGDQIARGAVDPRRALDWIHATADALDAAHDRGIVHRDIKPGNLLLDEHDKVAVADFGIARIAHESDRYTQTGQVLGTAAYLSPEQAVGDAATAASDRYALAAVAFELLTGRKPFEAAHFAAQARAHIEDPVPSASAINPQLPRAVDAVLRRGLAKEPGDRWSSARAFADALDHALEEGPVEPTRAMPTQPRPAAAGAAALDDERDAPRRAGAPAAPPDGRDRPPREPRDDAPARRRRSPVGVLAAVAALLAAAVAAALIIGSGGGNGDGGTDPAGGGAQKAQSTETAQPTRTSTPDATRTAEPTATSTPEPTSTSTPEPTPTATPTSTSTPDGGGSGRGGRSPTALNDQGFRLMQAGNYAEAVPVLRRAVNACGDSGDLVCQYALFNLGSSLYRSGDPASAIPVLEQRLQRFPDNQPGAVRKELKAARKAAKS